MVWYSRRVRACFLAALAVVSAGCGDHPEVAPVSGTVLLDGKPLEFGIVMMQPVDGGEPSQGQIQNDGTYHMTTRTVGEGARVGPNRVRVACFAGQQGGGAVASDGELMLGRSLIPKRYNSFGRSGLSVEVPPEGLESYVIELSSE